MGTKLGSYTLVPLHSCTQQEACLCIDQPSGMGLQQARWGQCMYRLPCARTVRIGSEEWLVHAGTSVKSSH